MSLRAVALAADECLDARLVGKGLRASYPRAPRWTVRAWPSKFIGDIDGGPPPTSDASLFEQWRGHFEKKGPALSQLVISRVSCTAQELKLMESLEGAGSVHDEEARLVASAKEGDRRSLELLLRRHQPWIYNIALRMTGEPAAAEDVTQECLIKIVTRLSSFCGTGRLRTWLYRIVVNHVLNMKRQGRERLFDSSDPATDRLMAQASSVAGPPPTPLAVEEVKNACLTGMLLCLDREERLVFIIGGIFGVRDVIASELLETTPAAYRKKLSRARRQLLDFMNGRCGLLDPESPCRCPKKTQAAIRAGYVDPHRRAFTRDHVDQVSRFVQDAQAQLPGDSIAACQQLFRETSFQEPPDLTGRLTLLLESEKVSRLLDFGRHSDPRVR